MSLRLDPQRSFSTQELLYMRSLIRVNPAQAGPGWADISRIYSALARRRTGRLSTLVAVVPEHAPLGAPGAWMPATDRIVLQAHWLPTTPDRLDTDKQEHFQALAALHGVLKHEIGHAVHTKILPTEGVDPALYHWATLLEEIRMEAQVVRTSPADARWLRAASQLLLLDANAIIAAQFSAFTGDAARLLGAATLLLGRVAAGVLKRSDIDALEQIIVGGLGREIVDEAESVWAETISIADGDGERLMQQAERLHRLLPPQEQGQGSGNGGSGGAEGAESAGEGAASGAASGDAGQALDALRREIDHAAATAATEAAEQLARERAGHEEVSEVQDLTRISAEQEREERERIAANAGLPQGQRAAWSLRAPSPAEQRSRALLALHFRRAKIRERHVERTTAPLPPGRVYRRGAARLEAQVQIGLRPDADAFYRRSEKTAPQPRLRLGVLIDTSGSMGGAIGKVSSALWVLANACRDAGGMVAAAGFGDAHTELLTPQDVPGEVREFRATGGTAFVYDSLLQVATQLNLTQHRGPKLVAIVSDGCWMIDDRAQKLLDELRAKGCIVALVGIDAPPAPHDTDINMTVSGADDLTGQLGDVCRDLLRTH